jgi:hypothetical protein
MSGYRVSDLLGALHEEFGKYTDNRKGKNRHYRMGDLVMSAYSVFFMQSPSYLWHQRHMRSLHHRSNLETLFGMREIPSESLVRQVLDGVKPEEVQGAYWHIHRELERLDLLKGFRGKLGILQIAFDGTWAVRSKAVHCESCHHKQQADGMLYYHSLLLPVVHAPGEPQVLALPPEVLSPQDGSSKQDCEINAAKRWAGRWGSMFRGRNAVATGDDLYAHEPMCRALLDAGMGFLFTCKQASHKGLYEELALREAHGMIRQFSYTRGEGSKEEQVCCRYAQEVPLCADAKSPGVSWMEANVCNFRGEKTYYGAWITSLEITPERLPELVRAARARWKIENEGFRSLKRLGYHLEHNFGHGHRYLANTLLMLNILAFLTHTFLHLAHEHYASARSLAGPRIRLIQHIEALTAYSLFESWEGLFTFMIKALSDSS